MDSFDLSAESLDRVLKPKDAKAPSLCILEVNGDYQLGYVVYVVIAINTMAHGPLEALLALMAVYYMFDLDYPGVHGQTLGFLQESAGWTTGLKQVFVDLGAESLDRVLKPKDAKAPSLCILEVNGDYQLGYVH